MFLPAFGIPDTCAQIGHVCYNPEAARHLIPISGPGRVGSHVHRTVRLQVGIDGRLTGIDGIDGSMEIVGCDGRLDGGVARPSLEVRSI